MAPIEQLTPLAGINPVTGEKVHKTGTLADAAGQSVFGSIFQSAIDNVKQTDAQKTQAQYLLSTGQLDNPAALTIAAEKESIALDLLIQLRNKALDAYSELTRINL